MNETALAALAVVIFGWAILSEWFASHDLTGPAHRNVARLLGRPRVTSADSTTATRLGEYTASGVAWRCTAWLRRARP